MSVFKCKMRGGALEINNNETVSTCEYCGTKQTLPKLDDERKANLYDRANHFRRNNEFDKAMGIYEQILNDDNTDAESYWSIVLCRYGIEYVEDPKTKNYTGFITLETIFQFFIENYTLDIGEFDIKIKDLSNSMISKNLLKFNKKATCLFEMQFYSFCKYIRITK